MAAASDAASENQTKEQMHKNMKHSTVTNHGGKNMVYKTKKLLKKDGREIFFIGDQPYLVKADHNDLAYSSFDKKFSRGLQNDTF